jgi:hypothetical protein
MDATFEVPYTSVRLLLALILNFVLFLLLICLNIEVLKEKNLIRALSRKIRYSVHANL